MDQQKPDGWNVPIVEGLWRVPVLFGVPPRMLILTVPLLTLSFIDMWFLAIPTVMHGLMMIATHFDPEWPHTFNDWLTVPAEIEP